MRLLTRLTRQRRTAGAVTDWKTPGSGRVPVRPALRSSEAAVVLIAIIAATTAGGWWRNAAGQWRRQDFALCRVSVTNGAVAAQFLIFWHCRIDRGRYGVRTASTVVHRTAPRRDVTDTRRLQICLVHIAGDNRAFRSI